VEYPPSPGVLTPRAAKEIGVTDHLRRDLIGLMPRLRRFAYAISGSMDKGDDLVQTACEKALSRLDQFQEGTRFDSWMFRIIQNSWIDETRRTRTRGVQIDPELAALSDHGKGARLAEDRMMLATVRAAMAALPEDQRAALALVAIEGLSYKEAADVLDIPVGTVMSRLSRARARLAELVRPAARGAA